LFCKITKHFRNEKKKKNCENSHLETAETGGETAITDPMLCSLYHINLLELAILELAILELAILELVILELAMLELELAILELAILEN
jgi:hypothetical protein